MDIAGFIIGVIGLIAAVAVPIWQHRKAKATEQRLLAQLSSLPGKLLEGIATAMATGAGAVSPSHDPDDLSRSFTASYADLDGDGTDELLVEVKSGAYASILLVYSVKGWEVHKIGELHSTILGGFTVGDFDGDGRIEVRTIEISQRPDLPYAAGLRDEVVYRLEHGVFVELTRRERFTEAELQERKAFFSDA